MRYPNGFPGWIDLATPDPDRAKTFYCDLFGWVAEDVPTGTGPPYTMLYRGGIGQGNLVCGLAQQREEQVASGVPSVWTTYILVGDVDEMVTATPGAGGTVITPAVDVMSSGRMAMVADPSGAVLGLWQPKDHQGADMFNESDTWIWAELQSRDVGAALPFFEELFGWRWETTPVDAGSDYLVAHLDAKGDAAEGADTMVAGALPMPPGDGDDVPSNWSVYFGVEDVDAAVARITELGGRAETEVMEAGPMRFCVVADPLGAYFQVMNVTTP